MYYKKLNLDGTLLEFHNNWLGEETVIAYGQVVSKKSSIWGTSHPFTLIENGKSVKYILITKVTEMLEVQIDLIKNGELIEENVPVPFGMRPRNPAEKLKKRALQKLQEYDLQTALDQYGEILELAPRDPEVHFHMACAHSVMENAELGFESLRISVQYGLANTEAILDHDMLAYLRIQPAFENFFESGFTEYTLTPQIEEHTNGQGE